MFDEEKNCEYEIYSSLIVKKVGCSSEKKSIRIQKLENSNLKKKGIIEEYSVR